MLAVCSKMYSALQKNQEKATFGFGCELTLTRNNDDTALQKAVDTADARIVIDHIHWYIIHCKSSIQQQGILSKRIFSKTPTEHRYVERSVFMKEVKNKNLWNSVPGNHESMNNPGRINIGFQQRERQN